MSPEKRALKFELALQDELTREFGRREGVFVLDRLKMTGNFGVYSNTADMRITFESLPLLGENCLLEALGELFKTSGECGRVFNAFKAAKEAHMKSGGKQAAPWHECALNFNCDTEKECIAKKLMAKGGIKPMKQDATGRFLSRNGIKKA